MKDIIIKTLGAFGIEIIVGIIMFGLYFAHSEWKKENIEIKNLKPLWEQGLNLDSHLCYLKESHPHKKAYKCKSTATLYWVYEK